MIKKVTILILITLCFTFYGTAQSKNDARDSTSTVIIFKKNSKKNIKKRRSSENNIIKITPLGFISGRLPLSYEKRITDFFSVQVTSGITFRNYSRNFWQESLGERNRYDSNNPKYETDILPSNVEDRTDPMYNFDHRKANLGYMFSLQPRLYFDNDGLEGSFIALSADYYNYNYIIPGLVNNGMGLKHTGLNKQESENIFDIMALWGWQTLYDNLSLEYTLGLGLRNISTRKYVAGEDNFGIFYEGYNKFKNNTVSLGLGIKVGYHF